LLNFEYPQIWFTYGPQTKENGVIRKLFEAGATGVRLTFSYGTPDLQAERAEQLRSVAGEVGKKIVVVADLQGEKCRFSKIEGHDEIEVQAGQPFLLTAGTVDLDASPLQIPIQIPRYLNEFENDDILVEGDGALLIRVLERLETGVLCAAETNGVLHPGRGVVLRKPTFRPAAMTDKDKNDLLAAASSSLFDAVAISFVSDPSDIKEARDLLGGADLSIIAKIETQLGIERINDIAREADCLMAARGDLALTAPWVDLYASVSAISNASRQTATPWIVATQLAEGLERFVFPTRAEICDLAHWISEGAWGAMLSFETAFGPRPLDSVRAISEIVNRYKKEHEPL
jgi:pyruvate kinase